MDTVKLSFEWKNVNVKSDEPKSTLPIILTYKLVIFAFIEPLKVTIDDKGALHVFVFIGFKCLREVLTRKALKNSQFEKNEHSDHEIMLKIIFF